MVYVSKHVYKYTYTHTPSCVYISLYREREIGRSLGSKVPHCRYRFANKDLQRQIDSGVALAQALSLMCILLSFLVSQLDGLHIESPPNPSQRCAILVPPAAVEAEASTSVHTREPWNRERLHLQLQRSAITTPPMPHKPDPPG